MKKIIVLALLASLATTSAFAFSFSSVSFRAYSTATPMSCSVLAGDSFDDYFVPFPGNSTLLSLGTKGIGTYTVKNNDSKLLVCCFPTVAGLGSTTTTRVPVKMFFNGSESFVFPGSEFKLSVK